MLDFFPFLNLNEQRKTLVMESTGLCQTGVVGFPPPTKRRRKDRFIYNNHSFAHYKLILDTFIEVDD